jgi:ElaB/YqjD/DUF883 family membrane-anchored ribosome-binding protein
MTALSNTRDALGSSWSTAGRHARRIARHGRHAAEDIGDEMRTLLADIEKTLSEGTSADAAILRDQLKKRVDAARMRLDGARDTFRDRATTYISGAEDYVRENPWGTVALVGGVALVTGWLLARNHD